MFLQCFYLKCSWVQTEMRKVREPEKPFQDSRTTAKPPHPPLPSKGGWRQYLPNIFFKKRKPWFDVSVVTAYVKTNMFVRRGGLLTVISGRPISIISFFIVDSNICSWSSSVRALILNGGGKGLERGDDDILGRLGDLERENHYLKASCKSLFW